MKFVTSAHLVSARAPEVSEFEFGLIMAGHAFGRWVVRCMAAAGQPDLKAIHEALIDVKKQFPNEGKVIIVPTPGTNYDLLIAVMDTLRGLEPTDPPIFVKNAQTGLDEQAKLLFPDVIFGNLLGDS